MAVIDIGFQICFMCGTEVEVTSVVKTDSCTHVDLDLRPRGSMRYAEKNYVHLCPICGYANFNLEQDLTKGNKDFLDEEYYKIANDKSIFDDGKKFYLVGLIFIKLDEIQKAATSFLRAAWFFGDNQDNDWMEKSRLKVIELLEENEFTWKNAQTVLVLTDCYRRIGKFKEALNVIDKFGIENVKDDELTKIFEFQRKLSLEKDSLLHNTNELVND